jgi:hypothetical protein
LTSHSFLFSEESKKQIQALVKMMTWNLEIPKEEKKNE